MAMTLKQLGYLLSQAKKTLGAPMRHYEQGTGWFAEVAGAPVVRSSAAASAREQELYRKMLMRHRRKPVEILSSPSRLGADALKTQVGRAASAANSFGKHPVIASAIGGGVAGTAGATAGMVVQRRRRR